MSRGRVLQHGLQPWNAGQEFRAGSESRPVRQHVSAEAPELGIERATLPRRFTPELDGPGRDRLHRRELPGTTARTFQDLLQAIPDRGRLDGGVKPVHVESTQELRGVGRGYIAGRRREPQPAFVAIEGIRVADHPDELDDPLGCGRAGPEDVEDVPAQLVSLTER